MTSVLVIGTSHIAQESVKTIREAFRAFQPNAVALELDANRYYALLHPQARASAWQTLRIVGLKGYLFALLGKFVQDRLGKSIGMKAGSDMLSAIQLAREKKMPVFLIDQDLRITLKNISKRLGWKEKLQILKDLVRPPVEYYELKHDLRKTPSPELIRKILRHLRRSYPALYDVLVRQRNRHMKRQLEHILRHHPDKRILVIVGAGHEEELSHAFR